MKKQEIKPLVSEQQAREFIEAWNGSIDGDWTGGVEHKMYEYVGGLYEADRAASRLLIEKLRDALGDNNGVLTNAANDDAYEQRDGQVSDNNALIEEANAFLKP